MPTRGTDINRYAGRSAQRRARIVELRNEGMQFREIAEEIGIQVSAVWQHYQAALRLLPAEALAEHADIQAKRRDEQLKRIDMERESVLEVLTAFHVTVSQGRVVSMEDGTAIQDTGPILAAVDRLVKLDDQEAKLLGLYAESKLAVSGGVRYEVVGVSASDLT